MNIEDSLKSIGLHYREIQVYLATLELGQSTVSPISKKSGFKRTYCYDILEELKKRKLVDYFEKNGRRRYFAQDPKQIEEVLKSNLIGFQALLPELRSIYNQAPEKPKVRYFEGKDGIMEIYQEAQNTKELLAIGSISSIYGNLGELFDEHIRKLLHKKVSIRELIVNEGEAPKYICAYQKPLQEARYLPEEVNISTDMMIFNNKLAMISYGGDIHAVVIESSSIVDTQKALFEIIWAGAERI